MPQAKLSADSACKVKRTLSKLENATEGGGFEHLLADNNISDRVAHLCKCNDPELAEAALQLHQQ